jgi:hypothetical protein
MMLDRTSTAPIASDRENSAEIDLFERCANCDSPLAGRYCASCGQSAEEVKRPAAELLLHALEALFDFDGRGMRSLKMLLIRPGLLTVLYLSGKRASFAPPVRLYLFVSLLFFAAVAATDTAILQITRPAGGDHRGTLLFFAPLDTHRRMGKTDLADDVEIKGQAPDWVKNLIEGGNRALANPRALDQRLSELFPKMMFGLVPFFAVILWLLYARRQRFLIEHLVFALHFHAFAFLLATFLIGVRALLLPTIPGLAFLLPATLYLLLAMKQTYRQGWFKTILKELILLLLYGIGFIGGMGALIFAGLSEI